MDSSKFSAVASNIGRPTKYNKDTIHLAEEYLAGCIDEDIQRVKTDGANSKTYEFGIIARVPTIAGLALKLNVSRETIYEWAKEKADFSDIIEKILTAQEEKLIEKGLSGHYNPTIAKVLLTKHGYSDKQEIDHTTKGESIKSVPNTNLDAIADEVAKKLKAKKTKNEIRA